MKFRLDLHSAAAQRAAAAAIVVTGKRCGKLKPREPRNPHGALGYWALRHGVFPNEATVSHAMWFNRSVDQRVVFAEIVAAADALARAERIEWGYAPHDRFAPVFVDSLTYAE